MQVHEACSVQEASKQAAYQLELGSVPEVLVRLPFLEFLQRVSPLSWVVRVGLEGVPRPPRCPGQPVVVVCSPPKKERDWLGS